MVGCILLALLLILCVVAPFIGIPLLILTLVTMVVVTLLKGAGGAVGGLFSRSHGTSGEPKRFCPICGAGPASVADLEAHTARRHP